MQKLPDRKDKMSKYKICVVGGWCGNHMIMIIEHLDNLLKREGFNCHLTKHSVWENYSAPPPANLVLQLLPAYTKDETECPIVNIRPLLVDMDHPATLEKVMDCVRENYPIAIQQPFLHAYS
jgi:hypothetical protein